MHILIIRLSSLGDVVLQTPVASWLKMKYPGCKISFLTAKEFCPLLEGHRHIDHVIGMERFRGKGSLKKLFQFARQLPKVNALDLIIDLHANTRSKLLRLFLPSIASLSVDKRKIERTLLVKAKIDWLKATKSIHTRNISDLSVFFRDGQELSELPKFIHDGEMGSSMTSIGETYNSTAAPLKEPYIVISAVASFETKRWPVSSFEQLIKIILKDDRLNGFHLVILGGPDDGYLKPLESLVVNSDGRLHYLQGKTNLLESIHYLKHSQLCVGNDTGLGHIAESTGVPVITLFGPTSPHFGFGVHRNDSVNLWAAVKCSPCSTLGNTPCKYERQFCMDEITPEIVLEEAIKVMT